MDLKDLKIDINYHTHTWRCGHSTKDPDELYVINAIKAGVKVLGFSDHSPFRNYSYKGMIRMDYDELPEYFASLSDLKEKYKDQIDIRIGLECEYYDEYRQEIKDLYRRCDYLILGQHFRSMGNPSSYTFNCDDASAKEYTERILKGLDMGIFTYLAHPDYFFGGTYDIDETFIECCHRICQKCEERNVPLEVNFNGNASYGGKRQYVQGYHYHYPNRIFWEIASHYDVRCIIGYDAHDPRLFLRKEELVSDFAPELDGLGLRYIETPLVTNDKFKR